VNQFTNYVIQFRQLRTSKLRHEDWYKSSQIWINSAFPRWRFIRFKELWIDSTRQKTGQEENNDTHQNKTDSIHDDTIYQFMNRFKMHRLWGKMSKTFYDTIQNSFYRINRLENHLDHEKRSFLQTTHKTPRDHKI